MECVNRATEKQNCLKELLTSFRPVATMRNIAYMILFGVLANFALCAPDENMYTTKYDDINVDQVLKSERLLKGYVGCLLDEKPCTADGHELKKNLPDALTNGCASCSEAQKIFADKLAHHLIEEDPEEWFRLEAKYDTTGSYRKLYLENKIDSPAD